MFTEEMAREIGIAYAFYCLDCQESGKESMKPFEFTVYATSKIEEIRNCKGLLSENDVCG